MLTILVSPVFLLGLSISDVLDCLFLAKFSSLTFDDSWNENETNQKQCKQCSRFHLWFSISLVEQKEVVTADIGWNEYWSG